MNNPFSELSEFIPAFAMQGYVILMFVLVVGGTILDMLHKKSAQYFLRMLKRRRRAQPAPLVEEKKHRLQLKPSPMRC